MPIIIILLNLASCRSTRCSFALKIIDKSKCKGKEHMIESEVDILRKVRHPNIVRLYAEHDEPEHLYLVMELVKVCPLFLLCYCLLFFFYFYFLKMKVLS